MYVPPGIAAPQRDHWPLALAALAFLAGVVLLAGALTGFFDGGSAARAAAPAPPPVTVPVAAPAPAAPAAAPVAAAPVATRTPSDVERFATNDDNHVRAEWVGRFYSAYYAAAKAFGVNWLLIASIHKQETGFSTHPTTYRGLNFAGCCGGPMQFNVTNGPVSTWERYRDAYLEAPRPALYGHATVKHPSLYDDFDAIMAAGKLLRDSGAGEKLDVTAWRAAYDYYGHDLTGVDYATTVTARALGWGRRRRFCINCPTDPSLVRAVDAAWAAPVRAAISAPVKPQKKRTERPKRS